MKAVLAVVLLTTVAHTAPEHATAACKTTRCNERVARKQCSQSRPVPCVRRAALHWDVSFPMLLRKARCESGLRWWARNGVHVGIFQFLGSTWASTPYRWHSPFSAKWSSLAAGYMHHAGRGNEWSCR